MTDPIPAQVALATLDQEELLHLARNAGRDGGSAMVYLKEAVSREDAGGMPHYMLGAEYAQIGMYDRAVESMQAALAINPGLSLARFQLGLLLLTMADAAQSAAVLAPLDLLESSDPLYHFGMGLRQLARDEFAASRASLMQGMALNDSNPPLNADMQRIVDKIDAIDTSHSGGGAAAGAPDAAPGQPVEEELARHIMLSAYAGNAKH